MKTVKPAIYDSKLIMRVFGMNTRYYRLKKRMTWGELAKASGLSVDQVGKIEDMKMSGTFKMIASLANALNVEPADLLDIHFQEKDEEKTNWLKVVWKVIKTFCLKIFKK